MYRSNAPVYHDLGKLLEMSADVDYRGYTEFVNHRDCLRPAYQPILG